MSRAEPGRPQLHLHAWKGGVMAMESMAMSSGTIRTRWPGCQVGPSTQAVGLWLL